MYKCINDKPILQFYNHPPEPWAAGLASLFLLPNPSFWNALFNSVLTSVKHFASVQPVSNLQMSTWSFRTQVRQSASPYPESTQSLRSNSNSSGVEATTDMRTAMMRMTFIFQWFRLHWYSFLNVFSFYSKIWYQIRDEIIAFIIFSLPG